MGKLKQQKQTSFYIMKLTQIILAICFLALPIVINSIVWRADKTSSDYEIADSEYPAVFALRTKGNCAATLVDSTHAVTAAHCFSNNALPAPFTVTINGSTYTVDKVIKNVCWRDECDAPNSADLAVVRLSTAVTGVTAYSRYSSSDEVGQTLTLIGWGDFGPAGATPAGCESTTCDNLREGTNIFTATGTNTLKYALDDPTASGSTATTDEAISWSGDSGGPAFLTVSGTTYLAGINSGGTCCNYGSIDEYVRVSTDFTKNFIDYAISNGEALTQSCCAFNYGSSCSNNCSSSSDGMLGVYIGVPVGVVVVIALVVALAWYKQMCCFKKDQVQPKSPYNEQGGNHAKVSSKQEYEPTPLETEK